ncbi:hypothetical protein C8A01DRAFT_47057 [Parachaetomium inaequale]|uniref:RNase T2-like C-terminal domain-containing protein n=1 Tax=Parachaetomium inaequale TaxID=2588326 RepID=A0AAN6PJ42_9PEZI|nr:hypothetical protein C8A01DRAFT_47057 [Parachaetomium inaequale]
MLSLPALLLTLTAALAAPTSTPTKDFSGYGQLRTLYIHDDHEDLGCLTAVGKWTADESQCGIFVAEQLPAPPQVLSNFQLSAPGIGNCGIEVATFKCGEDVKPVTFGTWGTKGPVPGRDVLRYSQYGVFATNAADSPPALKDEALDIHFYSGAEKGKWVWLGWEFLFDIDSDDE